MATFDVADLSALEILDSRGRPTLAVTVRLSDGAAARAGVFRMRRRRGGRRSVPTSCRPAAATSRPVPRARGERVAKYNRLLEIAATVPTLRYGMPVG